MVDNEYKGILIAVDGPNGAGKTTLIAAVESRLRKCCCDVLTTVEPTISDLGEYVRHFSEEHDGYSLACLVAADRYEHLKNEIVPALKEGKVVITDRYILSSLILQGMDGVSFDDVMSINKNIIKPDLQIMLYADKAILHERLMQRSVLTRFEKNNQSEKEIEYANSGVEWLRRCGVRVLVINNTEINGSVTSILSEFDKLRGHF